MMQSVAKSFGENAVGVILTGMGKDGVEGIRSLKNSGAKTIAQDEKTSVIFGMNQLAIAAGLVDVVAPLHRLADEIVALVSK
jgi:two-component system chemotaxis response regulator CheB